MYFKDRRDAGRQLGLLLEEYKDQNPVIFALPRGGVVLGEEIAKHLNAPLDLIFAHKIGHPYQPEYAIAAVSESGHIIGSDYELRSVGEEWIKAEKIKQMQQIKRRREKYLKGRKDISLKDKVAIIVDDGIATGLTMQVGIMELKDRHPKKIVVAVPVAPRSQVELLGTMVDKVVTIEFPDDHRYLGAVGAYYDRFDQVEDDEVVAIMDHYLER